MGLEFWVKQRAGRHGLVVSFAYGDGLRTSDGKAPSCFEIAEEDGLYYPAQATIEGSKVLPHLPTDEIAAIREICLATIHQGQLG